MDDINAALTQLAQERTKLIALLRPHCGRLEPEDVLGDVVVRLIGRLYDGHPLPDHLTAYLLQAAKNHVIDHYRSPRSREVAFDPLESDHLVIDHDPHLHAVDTAADRALIRQAFSNLSPDQQHVLKETVIDGQRPRKLTTTLGLTAPRIATATHRARKALRTEVLRLLLMQGPLSCQRYATAIARRPEAPPATASNHLHQCPICQQHIERFNMLPIDH